MSPPPSARHRATRRRRSGSCRAVVTGGSGFVGGHVAAAVREAQGDTPTPVRLMPRDPASLPLGAGPYDGTLDADAVRADPTDPPSRRGVCDGIDVVLHCASRISGISDDERLTEAVDDHGTGTLVEVARRAPARPASST